MTLNKLLQKNKEKWLGELRQEFELQKASVGSPRSLSSAIEEAIEEVAKEVAEEAFEAGWKGRGEYRAQTDWKDEKLGEDIRAQFFGKSPKKP